MASLGDLPGFGKPSAQPVRFKDEDSGGFDDFDFEEDVIGDSSNKFDDAEKHLRDFEQEQQTGYKFEHPASKGKKQGRAGFQVAIGGINNKREDDEDEEEIIEEDIQTDRDEQNQQNLMRGVMGGGLTESGGNYGGGITVS